MQVAWNKGLTKEDKRVQKYINQGIKTRTQNGSYKHSDKTKEKISNSIRTLIKSGKGNPFKENEKNISWNGGTSFEIYPKEFKLIKKSILERDNHTCQECGYTQIHLKYKLAVHHIDYNKKNNSKDNLITLCKSCHQQTNFNRNDWKEYFQGRLK